METITSVPAIRLKGFSFGYLEETLIGPIDWSVEEGSFTLLVGSTGSGKTTLLRNLKPELAPTGSRNGCIELFGVPIQDLDAQMSAQSIGYVSQSPENQIVCDTVWHELAFGLENLAIPQAEMRRRVAEVSNFFGIEPWLEQATDELSGGQKQLLTLASILALRPRILLLDEPTSQLDPVASKNFLHALFRVNRELGLTVLVATHEPEIMTDYATSLVAIKGKTLEILNIEEYRSMLRQRVASVDFHSANVCAPLAPITTEDVVRMTDVYVRYKRELPFVLRGCDFKLQCGTIHALVGGNGSGKSTMLSTIAGLMKIDRGTLRNTLRERQALLPQNPKTLFVSDSVADELAEWQQSCGYSDKDIDEITHRFNLDHLLRQHPYDLSGGQQQLLACAKIFLTKPNLLLMDEPSKGLDVNSKSLIADALCSIANRGATIILVTHDLAFASRIANVTSMLFDGAVVCTQPTGEFFAENLFYRPVVDRFFTTWIHPRMRDQQSDGKTTVLESYVPPSTESFSGCASASLVDASTRNTNLEL